MINEPITYAIQCDWCKDKIEAGEDFLILNLGKAKYLFCTRDCLDEFVEEHLESSKDGIILKVDDEEYQFCTRDRLNEFIDSNITYFNGSDSEDYINANGEETTERNSAWGMYYD